MQNVIGVEREYQLKRKVQETVNMTQVNNSLGHLTSVLDRTDPSLERANFLLESIFILVCLVLLLIGRYYMCLLVTTLFSVFSFPTGLPTHQDHHLPGQDSQVAYQQVGWWSAVGDLLPGEESGSGGEK